MVQITSSRRPNGRGANTWSIQWIAATPQRQRFWMKTWEPRTTVQHAKATKFGYRTTGRGRRTHRIQYFFPMISTREGNTKFGNRTTGRGMRTHRIQHFHMMISTREQESNSWKTRIRLAESNKSTANPFSGRVHALMTTLIHRRRPHGRTPWPNIFLPSISLFFKPQLIPLSQLNALHQPIVIPQHGQPPTIHSANASSHPACLQSSPAWAKDGGDWSGSITASSCPRDSEVEVLSLSVDDENMFGWGTAVGSGK